MQPVTIDKPISELDPIDVKCSHASCKEGFHYYTSSVAGKGEKVGDCKYCGDDSIDWQRIYLHNPDDILYTFESLRKELLRHVCWVNKINPKAILRAKKRGLKAIRERAKQIVSKKIGHPPVSRWDYRNCPQEGTEVIEYGRHATATCCRPCLERWHNIPQNAFLTEEQIKYCVDLVELYVKDRVPEITENGDPQIKTR